MSKSKKPSQDICLWCLPRTTRRAVFFGRCREHLFYEFPGLFKEMVKTFDHAFWGGMALLGLWNQFTHNANEDKILFFIVTLVSLIGLRQSFRKS